MLMLNIDPTRGLCNGTRLICGPLYASSHWRWDCTDTLRRLRSTGYGVPSIHSIAKAIPCILCVCNDYQQWPGPNYASHKPLSSHTSLFSWSIACCIIARLLSFRYEDFHSPTAPLTIHNFALCVPHAMSFLQKFRSSVILIPTQHKLIIHSVHLSIEFNYFYDINTTIWREAKEEC